MKIRIKLSGFMARVAARIDRQWRAPALPDMTLNDWMPPGSQAKALTNFDNQWDRLNQSLGARSACIDCGLTREQLPAGVDMLGCRACICSVCLDRRR
jgi:hypothetical protein